MGSPEAGDEESGEASGRGRSRVGLGGQPARRNTSQDKEGGSVLESSRVTGSQNGRWGAEAWAELGRTLQFRGSRARTAHRRRRPRRAYPYHDAAAFDPIRKLDSGGLDQVGQIAAH